MFLSSILLLALVTSPIDDDGPQLKGSTLSMRTQHQIAQRNDFTFLRSSRQVREFIAEKRLVKLSGNRHYAVKSGIAFPYARPAVRTFVENLAAEFYVATGERLVVTSLTRPISRQPRNASELSVHPAGMAVDLRVPAKASSRRWLEQRLLQLEDMVVLDATKERKPAHYHVAVFPLQYEQYVASLGPKS